MGINNKLVKRFLEQEEDLFTQSNKERQSKMFRELSKDENFEDICSQIRNYIGVQNLKFSHGVEGEDNDRIWLESEDIDIPALKAAWWSPTVTSGYNYFVTDSFTNSDDGLYKLEIGYRVDDAKDGHLEGWVGIATAFFHESTMKWELDTREIPDWR